MYGQTYSGIGVSHYVKELQDGNKSYQRTESQD